MTHELAVDAAQGRGISLADVRAAWLVLANPASGYPEISKALSEHFLGSEAELDSAAYARSLTLPQFAAKLPAWERSPENIVCAPHEHWDWSSWPTEIGRVDRLRFDRPVLLGDYYAI